MILVCGEALVDIFVGTESRDDGAGGLPARAVAGGSPFNLAIGLSRLGVRSGFLTGLSSDAFGRMLADHLRAEGVDISLAKASTRPTPLAIVSTGRDGHPAYTFHAENCAHADLTSADLPMSLGDDVAALALGSFSLAMEPVGTSLIALAEREANRRVVSLDPNLRPSLIGDLGRWRARYEGLVRHAAIVKLSDDDLRIAYDPEADPDEHAARWLAAGVQLVVVTAGLTGATGYHAHGRVAVPGRTVSVVDTVGAGDTFHAALLARLARDGCLTRPALASLEGDYLRSLLNEAAVAASVTCSRLGADLPTLVEVQAILAEAA